MSHSLCSALAVVAILTLAAEADASEVLRANSVVTGSFHTCAMRTAGGITCWGRNQAGALGYGDTRDRSSPSISPITFPEGMRPDKLFAGYDNTCVVLDDRTARCWGANDSGQLGTGDQQARLAPSATPINFAGTDVDQIAVGQKFSCAVLIDGGLSCWGKNTYGGLGYGHTADVLVPGARRVDLGPGRTALKVSLGVGSACALLDNHSVKCWGYNPQGELGYGDAIDRHAPPSAPVDLGAGRQANDIEVGAHSACAMLDGGDIKCWGDNRQGQLGYGDYVTRLSPPSTTLVLGAAAKQLLVGTFIGCVVLVTDRVKCWGRNDSGQNGYGDATPRPAPTNEVLSFGTLEVPRLSLENHHVCGRYADATVRCWGRNSWGNLGYGDTSSRSGPPSSLPALLAEPSCPDVQVVGVRGSRSSETQPSPLDDPYVPERATDPVVAAFVNRLRERTGLNVEPRWIRYDAAYALRAWNTGWDWGRSGEYNTSVDGGIAELKDQVADLQRSGGCIGQGTRVVLAGFSQGAQIIGRAVDEGMSSAGVNAIALFGDPTFSVDHSGDDVSYTSTLGKPRGALGPRDKDFPDGVFVANFCRPRDFVCDSLGGTAVACAPLDLTCNPFPEHSRYAEPIVIRSGPFWSYRETTLPPPTTQSADKIAGRLLSLPLSQESARTRAASPSAATEPPVVVFPASVDVRPNHTLILSAGLSYDPDGTQLRYEWDLDGNGLYDSAPSSTSWVEVSFAATPYGPIRLRVTNANGLQSTAELHIEVSSTAPSQPGAPTSLQAAAGTENVRLTWNSPADTGGLPITDYLIRDAVTGELLGFADDTRDITITALTPGVARSFQVAARNDAGTGLLSRASATVTPTRNPLPGSPPLPPNSGSLAPSPAQPPTAQQIDALLARLEIKPLRRSRVGRRRSFAVMCWVSERGTCSVKATITRRTAKELGMASTSRTVVVARGKSAVQAGRWQTIRLRTTKRFGIALRTYRRSVKIRASATAAAPPGLRRIVSKTVTIK